MLAPQALAGHSTKLRAKDSAGDQKQGEYDIDRMVLYRLKDHGKGGDEHDLDRQRPVELADHVG